jgi:hypothetical protein
VLVVAFRMVIIHQNEVFGFQVADFTLADPRVFMN